MGNEIQRPEKELLSELRAIIDGARGQVARAVNTGHVAMNWSLGDRIRRAVLGEKRAAYGKQIVATVSQQLTAEYGRGFSRAVVNRMIQFAEQFPDPKIVAPLARQLTWSQFVLLLPIKDGVKREFYAEMCRAEKWNKRILRDKINGLLYERTALSQKPADLALMELKALREGDVMSPDMVFQDPYVLDFLRPKDVYAEKDFEQAVLREMESFIPELGAGFTFVARQKRMAIGGEDFHLDLLFYNRKLCRLVAVELKLGRFRPEFKGQMELYLRWLDRHERQAGEAAPIGLILCSEKCEEQVELLELDKSGIRVAEYVTELPSRSLLEARLHAAMAAAKQRLALKPPRMNS